MPHPYSSTLTPSHPITPLRPLWHCLRLHRGETGQRLDLLVEQSKELAGRVGWVDLGANGTFRYELVQWTLIVILGIAALALAAQGTYLALVMNGMV